MQVIVAAPAKQELAKAVDFYDDQAPGLAQDLIDELDATLHQIGELPQSGALYHHGTRRLLLRRFPFAVIYRVQIGAVEVIAISHQRRRPDYWTTRV